MIPIMWILRAHLLTTGFAGGVVLLGQNILENSRTVALNGSSP